MYRSASTEYCHCRNKTCQNNNLQVRFQNDRLWENKCKGEVKSVKTQTEIDTEFQTQEQITELLSEIAVTLNQKSKLEVELASLQAIINKNEETNKERKKKMDEEMSRLINMNQSKDNLVSNLKIAHLEEQKALLAQINELKTEIHALKEEKEQTYRDATTTRIIMEEKLSTALSDLKSEVDKNENCHSKLIKYKQKMRFLAKYTKHLIDALNSLKSKKENVEDIRLKRSSISENGQQSMCNDNISNGTYTTSNSDKNRQPDIENMILSELFFKPNPFPMDIASLFFCSPERNAPQ